MKVNRVVLLAAGFVVLGCGFILSRVLSGGQSPPQNVETASRAEMPNPESQQERVIAVAAGPLSLGGEQTRVSLKGVSDVAPASRLKSLAGRRVYLVIGELNAAEQPGVPYQVFFDLPTGAQADTNSPNNVGVITFFNAVRLEGSVPDSKDPRFFSFDITEIVRRLNSKNLLTEDTSVTIKPGGTPNAAAKARIGRIEIIER